MQATASDNDKVRRQGMQEVGFVLLVLLLAGRTGSSQTTYPTGGLKTSKIRVQTNRSRTSFSIVKTGNASSLETGTINSSSVTSSLENMKSGASTATPSAENVSTKTTSSVDTFSAIQSNDIVTREMEPETPVSRTSASLVSGLGGQPLSSSSFVASPSGSTSHSFTGTAPTATKAEDIPLSSSFRDNSFVSKESTLSSFSKSDSQNFSESPSFTLHNSTLLGDSASSTPASGVAQELQSFFTLLGIVLGNSSRSMTAEFLPSLMNSGILLQNTLQKLSLVTQDLQPWPQCAADLAAFHTGLQKGEPWALQMIDAMGKPQAGILLGEKTLVGQYDECRGISQKMNDGVIEGLFCTLQVKISGLGGQLAAVTQVLSTVFVDICLPASCRDQADMLAGEIADTLGQRVEKTACVTSKDPTGDKLFWATIGIIAFLTLLGACGTVYGVYLKRSEKREKINSRLRKPHFNSDINMAFNDETPANEKTPLQEVMVEENDLSPTVTSSGLKSYVRSRGLCSKLLLSFSVLENGKKLLSFEIGQGDLSCLHGIRVITITWVILGHCYSQPISSTDNSVGNTAALITMPQDWTMMPLASATLSVDTFFLLSGCLTSYLFLRQAQKAGGITSRNMILYYVHRFWRLTPLYMITVIFYAGILPYLMSGPYEHQQLGLSNSCRKYWWANILYINNLLDYTKMCMDWSWYLSDDMQFYVIAPLMLVPWVFGKRTIGILFCIALIIVHIVTNPILITKDNLQVLYGNTQTEYMTEVYFPPWTRVAPFVIGVLLGYMLHSTGCKYTMQRPLVLFGWLSASAVGLTTVYIQFGTIKGMDKTLHLGWNSNQFAVYETISRPAWACAVAWVILACCTEHGGFVNTFLSWRGWAPLSRLTYGVYLFHLITFCVIMGNKIAPFHLSSWTVAELTISITVLTYMVSFVFSLLVESPALGLEKVLLGNRKQL